MNESWYMKKKKFSKIIFQLFLLALNIANNIGNKK